MTDQSALFRDDEFVYVDPETRTVIGRVEWSPSGEPRPRACPPAPRQEGAAPRGRHRKFYPWGTYASMKRIYRLEGKERRKEQPTALLSEALGRAAQEPYWD